MSEFSGDILQLTLQGMKTIVRLSEPVTHASGS
jgi:hypothetical protein